MSECIFCKIIEGSVPSKKVFENDSVFAFYDIQPAAPIHILIIPKKHVASMDQLEANDFDLITDIHRAAQDIARTLGVSQTGYRLVNNCGKDSGQIVHHIHYHLLGGEQLGAINGASHSEE